MQMKGRGRAVGYHFLCLVDGPAKVRPCPISHSPLGSRVCESAELQREKKRDVLPSGCLWIREVGGGALCPCSGARKTPRQFPIAPSCLWAEAPGSSASPDRRLALPFASPDQGLGPPDHPSGSAEAGGGRPGWGPEPGGDSAGGISAHCPAAGPLRKRAGALWRPVPGLQPRGGGGRVLVEGGARRRRRRRAASLARAGAAGERRRRREAWARALRLAEAICPCSGGSLAAEGSSALPALRGHRAGGNGRCPDCLWLEEAVRPAFCNSYWLGPVPV